MPSALYLYPKSYTYDEGNGERFNVLGPESMMGHIEDRVIQVTEEVGRGNDSQLSTRVEVYPGSREVRAVRSVCIQTIPTGINRLVEYFGLFRSVKYLLC